MDSLRQSCQAPKCCVEDSNLVSAAMEGNLEKVMVIPNNPSSTIDIANLSQSQHFKISWRKGAKHAEVR